jgi:hypothetical protein
LSATCEGVSRSVSLSSHIVKTLIDTGTHGTPVAAKLTPDNQNMAIAFAKKVGDRRYKLGASLWGMCSGQLVKTLLNEKDAAAAGQSNFKNEISAVWSADCQVVAFCGFYNSSDDKAMIMIWDGQTSWLIRD